MHADPVAAAAFRALAASAPDVRALLREHRRGAADAHPDDAVDDLLADRLAAVDGVGELASEEATAVRDCGTGYGVTLDPVDGSSNLAGAAAVGTVVGVYDAPLPARGRDLVGAGYLVYGSTARLVVADDEVRAYDVADGDPELAASGLTLPEPPEVFAFRWMPDRWPDGFAAFAREVAADCTQRYTGAMVADVDLVLGRGGLYAYPALRDAPDGKLRLQYEANPVAHLVEAAGGRGSDGERPLLDVEPTGLHQRVPMHVGNAGLVRRLESHLR
ncbi:MAG: class 1 fructose-bisphosphatase [Halobacteriaceae archaeon]